MGMLTFEAILRKMLGLFCRPLGAISEPMVDGSLFVHEITYDFIATVAQ